MHTKFQLSTASPGLVMVLVDQSGSMADAYVGSQSKADFAALAINRCVYEIIKACTSGEKIKDRCHLGIVGYGNDVAQVIVGGTATEVHAKQQGKHRVMRKISDGAGGLVEVADEMPVWVQPQANGGTPMAEGFREARELAQLWIAENPHNFPPIVINITDGEPSNETTAAAEAQALMQLATSDGPLILLNAHIAAGGGAELILPTSEPFNPYARFLFNLSSVLPPPLARAAVAAGLKPGAGARGCVFNAEADTLVKLLTFGSNPAATR